MFEEANEAGWYQRWRKDREERKPSQLLLSALFGDLSLEDAIPVDSAPLPTWHGRDPLSSQHDRTHGLAPPGRPTGDEQQAMFLRDGPGSPLDEFDPIDDPVFDPIDEVGRHLEAEGLATGQSFYETARRLTPELLHPRALERCFPGLEAAWPRLRYLIGDALRCIDLELSDDMEESVNALLDEPDGIPSVGDDCSDLLDVYRSDIRQYRVLSAGEQRILGQWIADGRLLHKLRRAISKSGFWDQRSRFGGLLHQGATSDADLLYAAYSRFVDLIGYVHILEAEPHSRTGWLTSFTIVGCRPISNEAYSRLESTTQKREDQLRAELLDLASLCRVLPAQVLTVVASALQENSCTPQDPPHGVEWQPVQILNRATAAKRALIRHNLRLALHISYKYKYWWQKLVCEQSTERTGYPGDNVDTGTEGHELDWPGTDELGPGLVESSDPEDEIDNEDIEYPTLHYNPGHGLEVLDLAQAGNMGLFSAAERWDYAGAAKYSTYATIWIRQSVMRAIYDHSSRIQIPVHMLERALPVLKETLYWPTQLDDKRELLAAGGIDGWQADHVAAALSVQSLDGAMLSAAQAIVDERIEAELSASSDASDVDHLLRVLNATQRRVLVLRYGLIDGVPRTLEEVGHEFGVTRERIRQIEAKGLALIRLRHHIKPKPTAEMIDFQSGIATEKPETERESEQVSGVEPEPRSADVGERHRSAVNDPWELGVWNGSSLT